MTSPQLRSTAPLTRLELTSILALVEYLEFTRGQSTHRRLTVEFEVTDIRQIKRRDYDRAVVFLVDLQDVRTN